MSTSITVTTCGVQQALDSIYLGPNAKLHKGQIKRLHTNMAIAKASFQRLSVNGTLKAAHLPLTLHALYFCLISERVALLQQQHIFSNQFHREWVEIKVSLSKENSSFFGEKNKRLNDLLQSFKNALAEAGVPSKEFDETVECFTTIFRYPFIGNIALATLFEKNGGSKKILPIELPAHAVIQSFELQLNTWQETAMPFLGTYQTLCDAILEKCPELESFATNVFGFKEIILEVDQCLSCLLSKLKKGECLEQEWFDECTRLIDKVWNRWSDLKGGTFHPHRMAFVKAITDPTSFFILNPLKRMELFLPSIFKVDNALAGIKRRIKLLRNYPSIASLAPQTIPPQITPRTQSRKKAPKPKKVVTLETPTLRKNVEPVKEQISKEVSSSQAFTVSLPILVEKAMHLYSYANLEHRDPKKREALLQAAWHLEKLNAVREYLHAEIEAEDYLNILSAVAFHASHCLEQLCSFKLLKANKNLEIYKRVHNLNVLSKAINLPSTPAISRVYLGTFWARYPLEEQTYWMQSTSFHAEDIPNLLENLIELATRTSHFTNNSFREYCERIYFEVEKALPSFIANSPKVFPTPITQLTASFRYSTESLENLIPRILRVKKESSGVALEKLEQCVLNIQMLERTLLRMEEVPLEQFTFFATRVLFLIHEATDNLLHALESRNNAVTTSHNLKELAEKLSLDLNGFGEKTQQLSHKLKYPFRGQTESITCQLVDKITSLRLHPNLEENFDEVSSIISYPLPLDSVSSKLIGEELAALITAWLEAMNVILKAMEEN